MMGTMTAGETSPYFSLFQRPQAVYKRIAEKVAQVVKEKGYSQFYTISAGVLAEDFAGKGSDDIMKLSEFALNEAKRSGRNQMACVPAHKTDSHSHEKQGSFRAISYT